MRNIHELLKILEHSMVTYFSAYNDGICLVIPKLWIEGLINEYEKNLLLEYVRGNKPTNLFRSKYSLYYWKPGRFTPRMRWIKKHIKLTNEDYKRRHARPFG
jgi:hypothetical protein